MTSVARNSTIPGRAKRDPGISNKKAWMAGTWPAKTALRPPGHDGVIVADLTSLTLAEARDGLRAKKFSAREIAQAHVAAVERARDLNAFVLETPERALEMAAASDKRIAAGKVGPLEGLPLAIRISSAPKAYARQPARRSSRISFLPTSRRSRQISGVTARCCSARPTWTSSPWGRRTRHRASAGLHPWRRKGSTRR